MTRFILIGSFGVNILLLVLLFISMLSLHHGYVFARIALGFGVLLYLCVVAFFVYRKHPKTGAWLLICLYGSIGLLTLHTWGINAPIGILMLSFVIVLTSVMLGAKYIIGVTVGIIICLIVIQHLSVIGLSQPDRSMLDNVSTYGDVASYSVILSIFTLISWLSGRKTEKALERAVKAETTLQSERDSLTIHLEERTKSLKDAQQKELKQLYKFAELGQLTTIILHELANYLSILTLDIDDINERHEGSVAIKHARESIFYIDMIIDQVRNQIKDSDYTQNFDALHLTKDTLSQLRKKLSDSKIKLFIEEQNVNYTVFGDPLRLSQAITILVTNAAQANRNKESEISVEISLINSKMHISVKDFGKGITKEIRQTLFQPQKAKKNGGMGIGLYVTKQIIETHFKGAIWLSPATEYTEFNIELPRSIEQTTPKLPT